MQVHSSDNAKHWYDRAAQMRVLAEEMVTDEAKRIMLKIADGYDRLGDRATEGQMRHNAERRPTFPVLLGCWQRADARHW